MPGVVLWFRIYCGAMAFLVLALMGLFVFVGVTEAQNDPEAMLGAAVINVVLLPFLTVFGFGTFIPQRKWAWIAGIVIISLGFTSLCTIPAAIALLIFWVKPETQHWFGRMAPPSSSTTAVFD